MKIYICAQLATQRTEAQGQQRHTDHQAAHSDGVADAAIALDSHVNDLCHDQGDPGRTKTVGALLPEIGFGNVGTAFRGGNE